MGFETKAKERTAQIQWEKSEKETLERIGREHGFEIEHKHGNREHFQKDVYAAYAQKEIAEKELKDTRDDLESNRNALNNIEKDLQKSRDEIEQLASITKDLPTMPSPDGTGFKKGYYSPDAVKNMYQDFKSNWIEERQKTHEAEQRADKAERELKTFGDIKPHELHNPDFLRNRAREIDKQNQQADRQAEEWQHEHSRNHTRNIEINGK